MKFLGYRCEMSSCLTLGFCAEICGACARGLATSSSSASVPEDPSLTASRQKAFDAWKTKHPGLGKSALKTFLAEEPKWVRKPATPKSKAPTSIRTYWEHMAVSQTDIHEPKPRGVGLF